MKIFYKILIVIVLLILIYVFQNWLRTFVITSLGGFTKKETIIETEVKYIKGKWEIDSTAVFNKYIEITKWFIKLKPNLYFIEINNNIITKLGIMNQINIIDNKINNISYVESCSICYNKSECITNCNHFFCIKCIKKWYSKNNACPYCRTKIKFVNK